MPGSGMRILVSGLQSGANPGPGLGLARSVRAAFPEAIIAGLDYGQGASTRGFGVFDDVIDCGSWANIDLDAHATMLRVEAAAGAFLLPGLDLQVQWLQRALPRLRGVLAPAVETASLYRKPCAALARMLGFATPEWILVGGNDRALHAFARRNGWRVWLKGPWYDAYPIHSWLELQNRRAFLASVWGASEPLIVQAHIGGSEQSICFAASYGQLLDAIHLKKVAQTELGKTWTGALYDLSDADYAVLSAFVAESGWHGGGELEYVVTPEGGRYLIECNPRFPAWIHGATLRGRNLVATAIMGRKSHSDLQLAGEHFSRVVTEVEYSQEVINDLA